MFNLLSDLTKAAVGVVSLPVTLAADAVTLGGSLTDKKQPYTGTALEEILKNLENAAKAD